jgi:hypothetical protein
VVLASETEVELLATAVELEEPEGPDEPDVELDESCAGCVGRVWVVRLADDDTAMVVDGGGTYVVADVVGELLAQETAPRRPAAPRVSARTIPSATPSARSKAASR